MELPSQVNNFAVWYGGSRLIGLATVTLPNLTNITDELKGAGIGGTIQYPVMAHYDDWTATFNFHVLTKDGANLMRQDCLRIECRAGVQHHDPGACKINIRPWRFAMSILPRGFDLGTLDIGVKENVAAEVGVTYIKGILDGEEIFELDKINMIARVLGHDYGAAIRQALGTA